MRTLTLSTLLLIAISSFAQGSYIPFNTLSMHTLDRFEIKSGRLALPQEFNTTTKAYQRNRIAAYVDSFDVLTTKLSKQDYFNLGYLQADNFEFTNAESTKSKRKFLGLYKYKAAALSLKDSDYTLMINPVTYLQAGYDTRLKRIATTNNRGVEIRGYFKNKLGFYTTFSDEITFANSWVDDFYTATQALPGVGFIKSAKGEDTTRLTFNYSLATGYIVYQPSKYFDVRFGHGKNFLGNGHRSLYMSDFSRENLFLRVNTRFWKINYTNIWGYLYDYVRPTQRIKPKRHYFATTYANINLTKNFNFGMFQTISFERDSTHDFSGYDPEYLNPIIFYKPVENGLNSADKTILGADFKWNFARHFQLYGQVVISEFKLEQIIGRTGWWGNKWATQFGLKYIDMFGISNLDLQLESNFIRPYMYTSFNPQNAYVNFNQNMAHPLGANINEQIVIVRYQPLNKLMLKATLINATYGNDTNGSNWGKDIRIAYEGLNKPPKETGNYVGQGIKTNLLIADLMVSIMIKHNLFLDLNATLRKTTSDMAIFATNTIFSACTIRWNFAERRHDF